MSHKIVFFMSLDVTDWGHVTSLPTSEDDALCWDGRENGTFFSKGSLEVNQTQDVSEPDFINHSC